MGSQKEFRAYLAALTDTIQQGDAREESFYGVLSDLLLAWAQATKTDDVHVTILPRPTEGGNPDFRVWDGRQHIIGYVEAKAPTTENLDPVAQSEQLKRYRATFPNLILTNFFDFRLYRHGELVAKARLARPFVATKLGTTPPIEQANELQVLLEQFFAFSLPRAYSAEELAVALALRTRFLRDQVVARELAEEQRAERGHLLGFYEAFREYLIAGLTPEGFADLYAQTITYGLFAARVRAGDGFTRQAAFETIPHTIGILRDVFRFISLGELPEQLKWIVDDISEVLAVADVKGILHKYFREGKGADPIVHFYETFLAKYDPAERERRGVYYTPEPVVSYIVRSLHQILKDKFGKADGLASPGVTLLDPAAGTMTFVAHAAKLAVEEFVAKYGEGSRASFIKDHILENFYAFELMMAPYAVGHLKMGFFLEELGYRLAQDERFKLYLTNTLEMEELAESQLPGFASLAEESHKAGEVKRDVPILVILGNPPYSGHSANKGPWIRDLIDDYKKDVPELKLPAQAKWLQDDYVKFLRFAEWKIGQAGQGVVGMITNHSYLDSPTFRGMRQHLMDTFDEVYILDLHGNSLKKETCPDGSPDGNVFDIRQGVAIALLVKHSNGADSRVAHADLWGPREEKYAWLQEHDWKTTEWGAVQPAPDLHVFRPMDAERREQYSLFWTVPDIFSENGRPAPGIVTTHDDFAISWTREEAARKVQSLLQTRSEEEARMLFKLCGQSQWNYERAKQELADGSWRERIVPVLYRPFDVRWTVYDRNVAVHRRERVMRHMLTGENIALITSRLTKGESFRHAQVTRHITEVICMSPKTSNNGFVFPLYLLPGSDRRDLLTTHSPSERRPNLNADLVAALAKAYGQEPSPEEIFRYVYAVLYARTYRETYAEFLRLDFPRIPVTSDPELFQTLAGLGERLVDLHLLRSPELDPPLARFQGEGNGKVVTSGKKGLRYDADSQRVYINQNQYFEGVPPEVWAYQIGGYQVCHKWLKDRKDRILTLDEIRTYCRIATALSKTIEIQSKIDKLYPGVEKALLDIRTDE